MNKKIIYTGVIGYFAWTLFLRTAIVGYNLKYSPAGVSYVGSDDNVLIFDIAVKITNELPFGTNIKNADLDIYFNGALLFRIEKQPINRRIYARSGIITPVRVKLEKRFFEQSFLDFLKNGDYINWKIEIRGKLSIDYLNDFPLNIDLNIYDFIGEEGVIK